MGKLTEKQIEKVKALGATLPMGVNYLEPKALKERRRAIFKEAQAIDRILAIIAPPPRTAPTGKPKKPVSPAEIPF